MNPVDEKRRRAVPDPAGRRLDQEHVVPIDRGSFGFMGRTTPLVLAAIMFLVSCPGARIRRSPEWARTSGETSLRLR